MGPEYQIVAAMGLDLLIGDPRWMPHPAKIIGRLALWLEKKTRSSFTSELISGIVTTCCVIVLTVVCTMGLLRIADMAGRGAAHLVSILILFTTIAARDLIRHSKAVYKELQAEKLELARKRASMMVGRSTQGLGVSELVRATVESVAENMVDGVIGPIFYGLLFGPAGAMAYRAINTLDSMFGYRNERYIRFGRFPARLDDVANYVPARIGALMVPIAARLMGLNWKRAWKVLWRDSHCHDSPNAGWPEAAFAGALGVRLGGKNIYGTVVSMKPHLGDPIEPLQLHHITKANRLMLCSSLVFLTIGLVTRVLVL